MGLLLNPISRNSQLTFTRDTESVVRQLDLMAEAALPVVSCCRKGLEVACDWLNNANRTDNSTSTHLEKLEEASASLQSALDDFKMGRLQILMPFRHLFDPNHPPVDLTNKVGYDHYVPNRLLMRR